MAVVSNVPDPSPCRPIQETCGATVGDAPAPIERITNARLAPLTGRDTEVSLLMDRWEQANEGMGQIVLLIGEAGLGKSRLVATLKEHVLGQMVEGEVDAPVIEWRCSPHFQNTGLYPAVDFYERALNFGLAEPPEAQFDRLLNRLEAYGLARPETVPLWASLLGLPTPERFPPLSLSPTRTREETFRIMREWMQTRAARKSVLFVVEDLHWVDPSTLEFLGQFLAEGLHDRILTVLTFRPEFKTPWPAVAHQTSLALNRLTRRQVGELVGKNAGGALPQHVIEQIHQRTGGVPLFVEELARMVQESRRPAQRETAYAPGDLVDRELPASLRELVAARLEGMTRNPEVAQLAATLGREFDYEVLAAIATVSEATLKDELATLVRSEILFQTGNPPRATYMFKHDLLEGALRDTLAAEKQQRFHRQIAETLESRFPETAQALPELLAHHFTEAGMVERGIDYWLKAGLLSRARFANVEAIGHLRKGLELIGALEGSPERDVRELAFLNPLGTVFIAAAGYGAPEVGPIFARAGELCRRIGEPTALFAMMWGKWVWQLVRGELRLCMELAGEALAMAERANEPGMLMEALFPPAVTLTFRGDFAAAHEHSARALAEFDDRDRTRFWAGVTGEDSGVAHRCYLAVALWHLGRADEALQRSADAVALARRMGQPFTLAFALEHRAWLCNQARLASEAQAAAEEEIGIATEQGFAYWLASASLFRADSMILQGQHRAALPLILKGIRDLHATGAGLDLTLHLGFLADAYMQAGQFANAAKALDEGLATAERNDERFYEAELHRLRGELLLAESPGNPQAESSFRKAIEVARIQRSKGWELRATTSLARLWQAQGRSAEARSGLGAVCAAYSQDLETPDLRDAKLLLETLRDEHMRHDIVAGVKYVMGCIPPPMNGPVWIDWRYIPSSSLGGDTIGYHWLDGHHLALYLIDVTGHGLDSALLSVTITNVLRSGSLRGADMRRPNQVLAALNDAFPNEQHGNKFFTIWFGVYDRSGSTLTWSGGGHHPSVLMTPGVGKPRLLASDGMMMGVTSGLEFPAETCQIARGARLLIFSDGIFEIIRDGRVVWNLEACIEYLAARSSRGGSLMDELLAHVRQLRGSHELEDDFSIVEACFP
ncbi:MAG TPA: SpoIIE family protein phosphatase [Tepidisphaeraceae bacterium]